MKRLLTFTILAVVLAGCKAPTYQVTVCLVDVSVSITPQGIAREFAATDQLVDHMSRGDKLVIIPITGSAISDSPGRVLRLFAPKERQTYDADLVAFRKQAHERIQSLRTEAMASPARQTDILGTLSLARQEFEDANRDTGRVALERRLWVQSDFIQQDELYNFASTNNLASPQSAKSFGRRLARESNTDFSDVDIRLDAVESSELGALKISRQYAIDEFWSAFFSSKNATVAVHPA